MTLTFVVENIVVVKVTSVAMATLDVVNQRQNVVANSVALTMQTVALTRNTVAPPGSRAVTKQSAVALATIIVVVNTVVRLVPIVVRTARDAIKTGTIAAGTGCHVRKDTSVADRRSVVHRDLNVAGHSVVRKARSAAQKVVVQCKYSSTAPFTRVCRLSICITQEDHVF